MSDLMRVIQEADLAAMDLERAREGIEAAKAALDQAKEHFDQMRAAFDQSLSKGEEFGIPRAKLRKLVEERTTALMASGLVPNKAEDRNAKAARPVKAAKKAKGASAADASESLEATDVSEAVPAAAIPVELSDDFIESQESQTDEMDLVI